MSCRKLKVPVLTTLKGTYMLVLSREVFFCHAVHEGIWSSTLENVPSEADCRAQEPLLVQSSLARELSLHCLSRPQEAPQHFANSFLSKGCDRQDASNTGVSISPILTSEGSGKVKIIITIYI